MFDPHDKVWFGYDLTVTGNPASDFLLTFGPPAAHTFKDRDGNSWT